MMSWLLQLPRAKGYQLIHVVVKWSTASECAFFPLRFSARHGHFRLGTDKGGLRSV
jgi:hypothetical protein